MGVERQGAKVNWLTSLALVVMGGTFYRLRGVVKRLERVQVRELMERAGLLFGRRQSSPAILPKPPGKLPGQWERVLQHRGQYYWLARCYAWSQGSFLRK